MVLKQNGMVYNIREVFESDVISDGTQTKTFRTRNVLPFESDVISDGTQTLYFHLS